MTLRLLGFELLDVYLGDDQAQAEYDQARDLSGGTLGSTPVGFTARYELPDGVERPEFE